MRFKSMALAAAAAALLSIPVWAHHSHANYNTDEFTALSGTITEVAWTNPHVWIYMEVANAQGRPQPWALEGGSPTSLMRGGWQRNSMKRGDKVSVRCHRLRDGSDGCLLGFVTNINGTAMDKEFD
jgi:Family of unknown function (DUF6152)